MVNREEAQARFKEKVDAGYFTRDRSQNTEDVHAETKLSRDTKAVENFTKTELFQNLYASLQEDK
ncbi:MAG: hypothetical protein IJ661_10225 [Lachnospiraceae bacterium]|nr:hypothetical protein [Lachnospiraceae bacterium]